MTKPASAKSLPMLEEAFARYVLARRRNSARPVQGQRADDPGNAQEVGGTAAVPASTRDNTGLIIMKPMATKPLEQQT